MPTTWHAVGPRNPTSWSGSPSNPDPRGGPGRARPARATDGGSSTAPPSARITCWLFDRRRADAQGQRNTLARVGAYGWAPRKSSGEMLSRNSRNFSTSSSCSSGMMSPASARTAPPRGSARPCGARAPRSHTGGRTPSRRRRRPARRRTCRPAIGDPDLLQAPPEGRDHVLQQVVGQRPRGLHALLRKRDRGGLDRADPYREITIAAGLPQQRIGWFAGSSTRTPTTRISLMRFLLLTVPAALRRYTAHSAARDSGRAATARHRRPIRRPGVSLADP